MEKETIVPEPRPSIFMLAEQDTSRILAGFAFREEILGLLCNAPRVDAIGAALAFVVHAAEKDPGQLRAVLNSVIEHRGVKTKMVNVITQIVR